ncbi:hypothetical protein GCM10012289_55340 [Nonomuraea cavernae]|uniref:Uncharacterized protein n=1 Tax=Nonomuraea cavernae TaxID=2045107 RepID=A0A917Z9V5_9ACTN|nr:hypothetical protein GCM10012289_55340 [Nonomuraea cavernae]
MVLAKAVHEYSSSRAVMFEAPAGSPATVNPTTAMRSPLGFPSHSEGQVAKVVLALLSPS